MHYSLVAVYYSAFTPLKSFTHPTRKRNYAGALGAQLNTRCYRMKILRRTQCRSNSAFIEVSTRAPINFSWNTVKSF